MEAYSNNDWRYYSSDEIYHHGILGQKWGVRRYQNEDGSLTSAGRAHYGVGEKIKSNAEYSKHMRRIQKGVENQNVVDRLERKGKTDTKKYRKYKDLADTRLADASEADIKLAQNMIKYSRNIGVSWMIAGAPGALAYAIVDLFSSSARERRDLSKQARAEFDEKKKADSEAENEHSPKKAIEAFNNDVNKANNAKTDEEHDRLNRQADQRNAQRQDAIRNYTREHKEEMLSNAKKNDRYDIEFLEAIQNKSMNESQRLKEYDRYLDDPTDYWLNRDKYLDKYDDE